MDNKSELFDLKREKRELDDFLSAIEEELSILNNFSSVIEEEPSVPMQDAAKMEVTLSSSAESNLVFEDTPPEISDLESETPAMKLEKSSEPPVTETGTFIPGDNEFLSKSTEVLPEPDEKAASDIAEMSATLDMPAMELEEASAQPAPEEMPGDDQPVHRASPINEERVAGPPENSETMTRLDERREYDEPAFAETPPPEEKKILKKPVPEKKKSKSSAYDFEPGNKSAGAGTGKWIGLGIGLVILLLIALLVGYFWFSSEGGGKTINIIKSYIPVLKTEQGATPSFAEGISLVNVRQKLIYNTHLRKSVRVIEGLAMNATLRPVSKIKIVANLYNTEGSLLASTESFCGNIIIDEQLESLDAKGMLAALKDVKTMEDRVPPQGQMPFMVVFAGEPAGVFKLSVLPVDVKTH